MKKLTEMPYYRTRTTLEKSKADIMRLLGKYGINNYQWTNVEGAETLKFIFKTEDSRMFAVQLDLPKIHALLNRKKIEVPKEQSYRMFFHSLKGLLEATEYGIMRKEDIFLANTFVKLESGIIKRVKELGIAENLALPP